MTKPIVLRPKQWEKLKERLRKDYNPSVLLIRSRMRDTLGFVVREHSWWEGGTRHCYQICLDFYDESKRTMFLLKYSDYLDKFGKTILDEPSI